ncbi:alpha-N-acetylgalactosaminidase-like [Haliotis rubra]|uniref:alpha-N-acetylgalactosaminidase-like n=1 Tax=Haliotis rubra TaxID=36100 RepID=UPI001EE573C4|nr:alpha-N-acetylgalactosaminidase-like [Haliotis rubra]
MYAVLFVALTCLGAHVNAVNNGLARTPPMGWMSWQRYRCITDCVQQPDNCISESLFKRMADRLVSDGYKDVGYEYVNIDDCWPLKDRDAEGKIVPDPARFPSGMADLAKYMHSKGLKLGIYGDFGTETCGGYPGSKFYMDVDAETFADWGIDSLKLDGCYTNPDDYAAGYPLMEFFLNKTGRPILYSCSWPAYVKDPDYKTIADNCNIWRNYGDIQDSWDSVKSIIGFYGDDKDNFTKFAGPGNFNDPDMIILGNFGLSYDQQRVQMAMWAVMASPLLMSNNLEDIRQETKELLLNKNLIAINQDPLGIQGTRKSQVGNIEIWSRPLSPVGKFAIAILNLGDGGCAAIVNTTLSYVGLTNQAGYTVTEGFTGAAVGKFSLTDHFVSKVNPSGIQLYVASPN